MRALEANGGPVATFNGAVNRRWSNPDGSRGGETVWFRVSAWRQLADTCNQFLGQGHRVLVVGRVSASAFTRNDGEPGASLELTASTVRFLGGRDPEGSRFPTALVGDFASRRYIDDLPLRRQLLG